MDFTGYDDLTLEPDEREWLKTLRQLSKRDHVEYGIAAHGSWVSRFFTDQQPNSVHIPSDILSMDAFSLYHSHTNGTLLSAQDLRLLLNPKVGKIAVITPDANIAVASVGYGYRPDMKDFADSVREIQMDVDMSLFDIPGFENWSKAERFLYYSWEQCYRIARKFDWRIEGGEL